MAPVIIERCASWRAWWRAAALALALGALAACDKAPPAPGLVEGQPFPPFMLDFISRRNDAASWHGKMLVLNIWATWCGPCRREMPSLQRLSRALDPKRFAVVGLSIDADAFLASEFLGQYGITFTNLLDQDGKMTRRLGVQAYPETFVIAPDRTLVRRMTGLHDWSSPAMVGMLERLDQAGRRAPRATTDGRK
jgi:thiol-disulfide isomerase/thioredoxin